MLDREPWIPGNVYIYDELDLKSKGVGAKRAQVEVSAMLADMWIDKFIQSFNEDKDK